MKKINNWRLFYIILILILLLLILLFSFRAYTHYTELKSHREHIRQPDSKIKSWMPLILVMKDFNITEDELIKILKIDNSFRNRRLTIDLVCKKNHLNCTEVVSELNDLRKK